MPSLPALTVMLPLPILTQSFPLSPTFFAVMLSVPEATVRSSLDLTPLLFDVRTRLPIPTRLTSDSAQTAASYSSAVPDARVSWISL